MQCWHSKWQLCSAWVVSGGEEIPHVQGQEQWLHFSGPAVWRYTMSKVRETPVRRMALGKLWGDTPVPRAKEKSQREGRRGEFMLRIEPHYHQRHWESSNKPCAHQNPGIPQRLRQNCVWESPVEALVGSGLPQGQGLWAWIWHKSSWRRLQLTPP